jgi:hypothetical protein
MSIFQSVRAGQISILKGWKGDLDALGDKLNLVLGTVVVAPEDIWQISGVALGGITTNGIAKMPVDDLTGPWVNDVEQTVFYKMPGITFGPRTTSAIVVNNIYIERVTAGDVYILTQALIIPDPAITIEVGGEVVLDCYVSSRNGVIEVEIEVLVP